MTILFVGGGTMGPVTPLIAVLRRMRALRSDLSFAWAGTPNGPERQVVEAEGIPFHAVTVAKWPRYPSLEWIRFPFAWRAARSEAQKIIRDVRPSLVASAGGFTAVPVIRVASLAGIPCAIHQLDAIPGWSNTAVASLCRSVTTSFAYETPPFRVWSGRVPTPNRFAGVVLPSKTESALTFGLDASRPVVLIVGGGTGAQALNDAVAERIDEWLEIAQILHVTGRGKAGAETARAGYVAREFLDENELKSAYAFADLVISRAGIGGISDLAALSKPAIFVPIPKSHQEENVRRIMATFVEQGKTFSADLLKMSARALAEPALLRSMGADLHEAFPTDDGTTLAKTWLAALVP